MSLISRFALILISISLYIGLSVLGAGGWAIYSSHAALIALLLVTIVLSVAAFFAGGNLSPGEREDRGNRWVIAVFFGIGLLLAFLPAYADRKDWLTIDGEAVRWIGVLLYAAGGALRIWPVFVLGNRFSGLVAIQSGHVLVTTGIYRSIRNPSYLGLLVSTFGWSLAFRSGVGVLLTASLIPPLVARMNAEERLLGEQFGAEYEAYRARTYRLIPRLY